MNINSTISASWLKIYQKAHSQSVAVNAFPYCTAFSNLQILCQKDDYFLIAWAFLLLPLFLITLVFLFFFCSDLSSPSSPVAGKKEIQKGKETNCDMLQQSDCTTTTHCVYYYNDGRKLNSTLHSSQGKLNECQFQFLTNVSLCFSQKQRLWAEQSWWE